MSLINKFLNILLVLFLATATAIAQPAALLPKQEMKIEIIKVKLPGDTREYNAAFLNGNIVPGTAKKFSEEIKNVKNLKYVVLQSFGGYADDAIDMAEIIHNKKLNTIIPPNSVCGSGCVLMAYAGHKRYMFTDSFLAVHRVHNKKLNELTEEGYPKVFEDQETLTTNILFINRFDKYNTPRLVIYKWMGTDPQISKTHPGFLVLDAKINKEFNLGFEILELTSE